MEQVYHVPRDTSPISHLKQEIKQLQKIVTISFMNWEAVYFGEPKRSLKLTSYEHKISVRNCDCEKNKIARHCWKTDYNFSCDQKKVVDRESRLNPMKIKKTMHSLKNSNHINKIYYMLPEIWLTNLREFAVTYLSHIRRT